MQYHVVVAISHVLLVLPQTLFVIVHRSVILALSSSPQSLYPSDDLPLLLCFLSCDAGLRDGGGGDWQMLSGRLLWGAGSGHQQASGGLGVRRRERQVFRCRPVTSLRTFYISNDTTPPSPIVAHLKEKVLFTFWCRFDSLSRHF